MALACPLCESFAHSRAMVDKVEILSCLTCGTSWAENEDGESIDIKLGEIPVAPEAV